MNYTSDEFFDLSDAVEDKGGEHLDEMCDHRTFSEFSGKAKVKPLVLSGCGESALFEVPVMAMNKEGGDEGVVPLKVCGVDDAVGAWPVFGGDSLATLSTKELFHKSGDKLVKHDPRAMGR